MKTNGSLLSIGMMTLLFLAVSTSYAGVTMNVQQKITLKDTPVDMVATPDGKYIFVLTDQGYISVFDQKGVFQGQIKAGNEVDQIKMGPQGTRLFVSSQSEKTVQIISLDFFFQIHTQDAPRKGPKRAPVVFAVFSDFQ